MGRLSWFIYNPSVITGVLTRGRQECQSQRRRCDKRVRVQREEAISQGMQAPLEAGKGKGQILPSSLQKEHSPADALILGVLNNRTLIDIVVSNPQVYADVLQQW